MSDPPQFMVLKAAAWCARVVAPTLVSFFYFTTYISRCELVFEVEASIMLYLKHSFVWG
jgi:hypothetical protein